MKYDIVFKTEQAYTAAKNVLIHHFACRFNDACDNRIEFYYESRRDIARKMLEDVNAVAGDDMEFITS